MSEPLRRAAFGLASRAATLIDGAPLNVVEPVPGPDGPLFRKRRRWYARGLAVAARMAGARFGVLSLAEWHAWEAAVYRQAYGAPVHCGPGGALCVPALPGEPLARLLADAERGWATQRMAVAAAVRALAELHQLTVALPGGARRFSHGDATARNVCYDPADDQARWFDFETAHPPGRTHAWRCADDLRALLFSAAALLGERRALELALIAAACYPSTSVLAELRAIVRRLRDRPDPFHLAQVGGSYELHQALTAALLALP